MSDGYPSMTALLGLLALAGFQNRDKISEWLGSGAQAPAAAPAGSPVPASVPQTAQSGSSGALGGLGGLLGGLGTQRDSGGFLGSGLSDLMARFEQAGHGQTAQSWVGPGANQPVTPSQLEQAIGPDVLSTLTARTGLSRDELVSRLTRELPQAVDRYTPDGRLPA